LNDERIPIQFRAPDSEDDYYGNMFVFSWFIDDYPRYCPIFFCPWCGIEFDTAFRLALQNILLSKFEVKEADCASFSLETKIPEQFGSLKNRNWFDEDLKNSRATHEDGRHCKSMECSLKEDDPVVYKSNIRTYGILRERNFKDGYWVEGNKAEYCDFELVNYCDCCGAKLPERLDQTLTEILQKEYGLDSWKDYKKAPEEFHTDAWWKKRGL
jgi:hypothetical protein